MLSTLSTFALQAALAAAACVPATSSSSSLDTTSNAAAVSGSTSSSSSDGAVNIYPQASSQYCLDVRGNVQADGTPVQVYECNGTGAQKWVISNGAVQLAGTNFCLDAGSDPASGVQLKIWTCYSGLAAQQWSYSDGKLSLQNNDQCVDLPDNNAYNSHVVQTWLCDSRNTPNQQWTTSGQLSRRDSTYDAAVSNVLKATCDKASATPGGKKAGLASGNLFDYGDSQEIFGWWYDWSPAPEYHTGGPLAIPMMWGGNNGRQEERYSDFISTWSSSNAPAYVLGFNEPDCSTGDSSDLDIDTAASLWNQYIAPLGDAGSFLLSPALCGVGLNGDVAAWHTQFKAAISGDYDAMAVHIYKTNLADVQAAVDLYYNIFNKPLWITEFACVDTSNGGFNPCDEGTATSFVNDVVPYLQGDGRVYAYALVDAGGGMVTNYGYNIPSNVGNTYLSVVAQYS